MLRWRGWFSTKPKPQECPYQSACPGCLRVQQVVQVQHRQTGVRYALKVVDKHLVLRHKQAAYIRNERHLLDRLDDAGIVQLHFTFQDAANLYLGLDLCPNGASPLTSFIGSCADVWQEPVHDTAIRLQGNCTSKSNGRAPSQVRRLASMQPRSFWRWSIFASSRCMISVHAGTVDMKGCCRLLSVSTPLFEPVVRVCRLCTGI